MSYCRLLEEVSSSTNSSDRNQSFGTIALNSRGNNGVSEAQQQKVCSNGLPSIHVNLDLPGLAGYLPTYWPGQHITGEVKVDLKEPMTITNFRIALFGNVQVYGSRPGQPLNNGIFDYSRNVQLINSGIRVMKKTHLSESDNTATSDKDFTFSTLQQTENDTISFSTCSVEEQSYHRIEPAERVSNQTSTISTAANLANKHGTKVLSNSTKQRKIQRKKTPEDRHMEKLIRNVAAITHDESGSSNGVLEDHVDIPNLNRKKGTTPTSSFDLHANPYKIRFAIRVPSSRRLAGSFDHPHYPICHRIVAVMTCRPVTTDDEKETTCYSTVRICLESNNNIQSEEYQERVRSDPVYQHINSHSVVYSYMLSTTATVSSWMHKVLHTKQRGPSTISSSMEHKQQNESLIPATSTSSLSSYIRTYAELPQKAFLRSQFIPIEVILNNQTYPPFSITAVKITVNFLRRIFMTCSLNEEVETRLLSSQCVEFHRKSIADTNGEVGDGAQQQSEQYIIDEAPTASHPSALFGNSTRHRFILSNLIRIPENCSCSVPPEATKEVYSLCYDLDINIELSGVPSATESGFSHAIPGAHSPEERVHYATEKHLNTHPDFTPYLPFTESYYHKLKTYTMQIKPLRVVVANSPC